MSEEVSNAEKTVKLTEFQLRNVARALAYSQVALHASEPIHRTPEMLKLHYAALEMVQTAINSLM